MIVRAFSLAITLGLLMLGGACGRSVEVGRYPADANRDDASDSGGHGGDGGSGGSGGSGGHDECAEIEPVCGRDGMTYMNACLAILAGVSIDHRGPCP